MTLAVDGFGINPTASSGCVCHWQALGKSSGVKAGPCGAEQARAPAALLQAAAGAVAEKRTALVSIKAHEAQLKTAPRRLIVSDEAKPQAATSVRTDLEALAIQGTPVDNDAAF